MKFEIKTEDLMNEILDRIKKEVPLETFSSSKENSEEENTFCDEEDILKETEDDFQYQIKQRGEDYYNAGRIIKVIKNGQKYYAKVKGTSEKPYTVTVENNENGVKYNCNCPYEFPCKHEYGVLMAISNGEYEVKELKAEIKENKESFSDLIKVIPAEEIKNYILNHDESDCIWFEMDKFKEHFRKYWPKQDYNFYYNNLYNSLVLNEHDENTIEDYINNAKEYVDNNDFNEGYKILKSIIEAYHDSNTLSINSTIIDFLPKIGMLLRIIYRKTDQKTKDNITNWIMKLKSNDYYNNYYLEDIIISLGYES